MSEETEPTAGDILNSKLGVHKVIGGQLAVKFLVTALLVTLQNKGVLTDKELETIFDVSTAAASDIFSDDLSPNAAAYGFEIRVAAEKTLAQIRDEIQSI